MGRASESTVAASDQDWSGLMQCVGSACGRCDSAILTAFPPGLGNLNLAPFWPADVT
jgi:hypothetical protein